MKTEIIYLVSEISAHMMSPPNACDKIDLALPTDRQLGIILVEFKFWEDSIII
jgi:hypothetical protein